MNNMNKTAIQPGKAAVSDELEMVEGVDAADIVSGSELHKSKSAAERRLLFKADVVILPVCALTWWITYLVCSHLSSARPSLKLMSMAGSRTVIPLAMPK
jgi:hypothetical protein